MVFARLHTQSLRQGLQALLSGPEAAWGASVGSTLWHFCRGIDHNIPKIESDAAVYTQIGHAESAQLNAELALLKSERAALGPMPPQQPFSG